jgi:4-amino-4-deoxy-L-arabinose transferase-like glycosyltransferase
MAGEIGDAWLGLPNWARVGQACPAIPRMQPVTDLMTAPPASDRAKAKPGSVPRLLLFLLLAFGAYVQFTTVSRTVVDAPLRADAGEYFSYAYNLSHYGTFSLQRTWEGEAPAAAPAPDKVRPPGYPLFLLLAGKPAPYASWGLRIAYLQAAVGTLSVLLGVLIGNRVLGRPWGLASGLLVALDPQLATISTYLLTESLFTFLLLASVWSLLAAIRSGRTAWFVATGLAWGATSLVRPTTEFFPPLLLCAVLALPALRAWRGRAAIAFACFALVLAPWVIRNQGRALQHGPSVMVNSLAHGSYPDFMYEGRRDTFGFPYRADPRINEITKDVPSVLSHIARKFRSDPATYSRWYLLGKPYYFLSLRDVASMDILIYPVVRSPFYEAPVFRAIRTIGRAIHWPLTILALASILMLVAARRWIQPDDAARTGAMVLALIVLYAIALHIIVAPFPRYSVPFRPLLFVLALLPLKALWVKVPGLESRRRLPSRVTM